MTAMAGTPKTQRHVGGGGGPVFICSTYGWPYV